MPRGTTPSVPVADLPEFMRSRTVAAIVAETLDHYATNQTSSSDATRDLIAGAAGELRSFHALPGASGAVPHDPAGIERSERERLEDENEEGVAAQVHGIRPDGPTSVTR